MFDSPLRHYMGAHNTRGSRQRDHIHDYLVHLTVERTLAAQTVSAYERDLKRLAAWARAADKQLTELTQSDISTWSMALLRSGLSARSVARKLSAASGFYKFLVRDGHCAQNPAAEVAAPGQGSYLPVALTLEQVERMLEAPDTVTAKGVRDRALLELFYACGVRVSELVGLKIGDVDLSAGQLRCFGKGSKQRKVPIGRSAVNWVTTHLRRNCATPAARDRKQPLFVGRGGRALTREWAWAIVKHYARQTGLADVSPHTFRHSFATHLLERGADTRSVQSLLGHANVSTTQIYTHLTNSGLRAAYDEHHPRARVRQRG